MNSLQNNIFIIGFGAIGKALAVFLKLTGRNVTIIRGGVNNGFTETKLIRVETADGAIHEANIDVVTLDTLDKLDGIVVLANKSYGNEKLAVALRNKTGSSPVVLLQNGLGVERPFIKHSFPEVYRSVLFVTSQTIDDVTVRFKPVAICPIGIEKGNKDQLGAIVQQLGTPAFGFKSEEDIQRIIWKKAISNCVFNSVCPLLEIDNGIFHRSHAALEIARLVISECVAVAQEKGILIYSDEVEESLLQISKSSDGQLISTLQDIHNKRKTEIETLNFEIVSIADSLGIAGTVPNTKLLGELIKLKADINLQGAL